ncbi:MAG: bifunctional (p)ppGpp synthetase/guanosine-3',5'-bis(diphosphate) 3'-pyrophosphohydrolase [Desulfobacterales bacterium]|nr:bifunctional (p)ppGpp synthetase/guanosine-3',5'-bis(diphosphate) 3'-pyrophosphohydrolase [Desulfobacterales bacterium]
MIRINEIIDKMLAYTSEADLGIVERAYIYSARVHEGQVRLSGEPYLSHPLEVAGILADMRLDAVSVASALLHDVIEDTHTTEENIREMFGPEVTHIVSGVTKLSALPYDSAQAREAESIRKMLLAMADDIRVVLIKLADRLHNMRTLQFHKSAGKQRRIAQETLDIYASIAARLGIYWIKNELEDLSFKYILPEDYERIRSLVSKDQVEREEFVETVKHYIKKKMDENHLKCEVLGRYKRYYSIFQKMQKQNLAFEDVYDIIAFRIILNTISQCYEALGLLHSLWKPVPHKFKDYIGMPKPNMYQSLHTTVIGPAGERIEIQIRTHEMDRVAKSGIAAHWSYKEGGKADQSTTKTFAWLQTLIENQENIKDPKEFLENVRIDLFPDEVYVFTPRGEIKSLPRGATPVDFAYMIHSEVGHQCVGAKVNNRMVPLQYKLVTGDIIEITTAKGHRPSKDWLKFVQTIKARSRIRQWIKTQEKDRSVSLGREMCEKAFRKHKLNFNILSKSEQMGRVVEEFGFKTMDDLIASVGYGKITPLQIVRKFTQKPDAELEPSLVSRIVEREDRKKLRTGVIVKGVDDILIRYGKCCQPVPGDSITGYITRGHGVTVHRTSCINALKMNPERQIKVEWPDEISATYPVKIHIRAFDRVGLLADVAASISKSGANIISVDTETRSKEMAYLNFTLSVNGTEHLSSVISAVKGVKFVQEVSRIET